MNNIPDTPHIITFDTIVKAATHCTKHDNTDNPCENCPLENIHDCAFLFSDTLLSALKERNDFEAEIAKIHEKEKQTALEVIKEKMTLIHTDLKCPNCGEVVGWIYSDGDVVIKNYCPDCGCAVKLEDKQ